MAATAAYLSTVMQDANNEDALLLKALTNRGAPTATSINTSTLLDACNEAIRRFQRDITTYEPDTYEDHLFIARQLTLIVLHQKTANGQKKAAEIYAAIKPDMDKYKAKRTMTPTSNSTTDPTERVTGTSPFDDSIWSKITPT